MLGVFLKKVRKTIGYIVYLLLLCTVVLELIYRSGWIDFYREELKSYNPPATFDNQRPFLSVFGDSFTAYENSYVQILRDSLPEYSVVNHSVSGTGILETLTLAPGRLKKYPSSIMVYQIYVGNDLANIHKNINWERGNFFKNLYYGLSNHLKILALFNYKAGQWKAFRQFKNKTGLHPTNDKDAYIVPFSPQKFSPYEQQSLHADSLLLLESVTAGGKREKDAQILVEKLKKLREVAAEHHAQLLIVVFPHCIQVGAYYQEKYRKMNLAVSEDEHFLAEEYPFIQNIRSTFKTDSGVKVINPLKALRDNDSEANRMYGENDFHASAAGQQVVGRLLLAEIRKCVEKK